MGVYGIFCCLLAYSKGSLTIEQIDAIILGTSGLSPILMMTGLPLYCGTRQKRLKYACPIS